MVLSRGLIRRGRIALRDAAYVVSVLHSFASHLFVSLSIRLAHSEVR